MGKTRLPQNATHDIFFCFPRKIFPDGLTGILHPTTRTGTPQIGLAYASWLPVKCRVSGGRVESPPLPSRNADQTWRFPFGRRSGIR